MRVAMLTAGGLAPCLSASIGGLIQAYSAIDASIELIGYTNGYAGLLKGQHRVIGDTARSEAKALLTHGGSPFGNSRVKLTNVKDCVRRGLVAEGEDPLAVAARQLTADGVTVLHTIGGDDTNTTAADLAAFLASNGYELTVVGLPKTIDNDVFPIAQSLGAATAAEQGAVFFENVVYEGSANPRSLVIHEVMGRNCGWLTAATARVYRERLDSRVLAKSLGYGREFFDIDAVYVPEMPIDLSAEADRLREVVDRKGAANIFVSEGAGVSEIVEELTSSGVEVDLDAFGHVRLDSVNVGAWFSKKFASLVAAEKALVQKSGYFARAAAPNSADLALIDSMVKLAVECGLNRVPGVVGHDEDRGNVLRAIEFPRIKGGKRFDPMTPWFGEMLTEIGQPNAAVV